MQTVKTALLILICAALVGACGLRGPLYLPDESQVAEPTDEQDSAAGTDEEEMDDEEKKDDEENDKKKGIVSG